jgi:hypothetical protein
MNNINPYIIKETGGIYLSVAQTGTARLSISFDGINWGLIGNQTLAAETLNTVVYSPQLDMIVIGCGNGNIYTSSDKGNTWIQRTKPTNISQINNMIWVPETGYFVGTAVSGTDKVLYSSDGISWTSVNVSSTAPIEQVTYSPSLDLYVIVGRSGGAGTPAVIYTSSNLTSWTSRTPVYSDTNSVIRSVEWIGDFGLFVTGDSAGRFTYSSNGTSWSAGSTVTMSNIYDIEYSPELGIAVAVSTLGTNRAASSIDGITWTVRTVPEATTWYRVTYDRFRRRFVAVATAGTNRYMYSDNGTSWTGYAPLQANTLYDIAFCEGLVFKQSIPQGTFVGSSLDGTNRLQKSTDGINWTSITTGDNSGQWIAIIWAKELGIITAVDFNRGTTSKIMYSTDGSTWSTSTINASNVQFYDIAYSPSLQKFSAIAQAGTARIYYSTNGINFTDGSISSRTWARVIWCEGFGLFVSAGRTAGNPSPGIIASSSDGETYTDRLTMGTNTNAFGAIGYSPTLGTNGRAVAFLTAANTGRYSDDGTTWSNTMTHSAGNWNDVAWSPKLGLFVAVSSATNFAASSTDGITWTTRTAAQNNAWFRVVWSDYLEMFVAQAGSGTNRIMYSTNGTSWTSASAAAANNWYGLTYTDGLVF